MNFAYRRYVFVAALLAAFIAPVAIAQNERVSRTPILVVSENVSKKWLTEDVVYIITDQERKDFRSLTTDRERDDFIENFWERRNPTPGSAQNKFKDEHYRRIAYANEHFAGVDPGWKTDRGRFYIMYGTPDSIESNPGFSPPAEIWHYSYIEGIGRNARFDFVDNCRCGSYGLLNLQVDPRPRIFDYTNLQ